MTAQDRPFIPLSIAVLTISDTRTLADDRSGDTLQERLEAGATLVQGYTAFLYRGPFWGREINRGLVAR